MDHAAAHPKARDCCTCTARHSSSSVAEAVDATLARIPGRIAEALRRDLQEDRAETAATALYGAAVALALAPPPEREAAPGLLGRPSPRWPSARTAGRSRHRLLLVPTYTEAWARLGTRSIANDRRR